MYNYVIKNVIIIMNNSLRNFARAFITPVKEEKSKKKKFFVICTVQGIQKYAEQRKLNFTATLPEVNYLFALSYYKSKVNETLQS